MVAIGCVFGFVIYCAVPLSGLVAFMFFSSSSQTIFSIYLVIYSH